MPEAMNIVFVILIYLPSLYVMKWESMFRRTNKNDNKDKGVERVCLISDHTTCGDEKHKNNEDAGIWFGPDLNYDDEGNLAGSLMTLDNGIRNVMTHTGYGLCHAIRMASLTPAQAIGIDDKVGSIKMGKKANLVLIDDTVNVKKVILEGNTAVSDGKICI